MTPLRPTPPEATAGAPSGSERVAAELRDDILRGRYRPGERLPSERDLAERFGVHRGGVREGFKKLEQLGLAHIRPGGARVAPLEEASLDVVEHLLGLEDPPDPRIVDQVLEVFSGLFAHSARLGVARADAVQRARIDEILERLGAPELELGTEHELFHELSHLLVEASGNLVLALVRRGLRPQFLEHSHANVRFLRPPTAERVPLVRQLARAVRERDGVAAAEAVYALTAAVRRNAVAVLEAERAARPADTNQARGL
jgi:GntR family transcriptional repressor for pyruvate dehydrogenase complex